MLIVVRSLGGHVTARSHAAHADLFTAVVFCLLADGEKPGRIARATRDKRRLVLFNLLFLALHIKVLDRVLILQDRRSTIVSQQPNTVRTRASPINTACHYPCPTRKASSPSPSTSASSSHFEDVSRAEESDRKLSIETSLMSSTTSSSDLGRGERIRGRISAEETRKACEQY